MYQASQIDGDKIPTSAIPAIGMAADTTLLTRNGIESVDALEPAAMIITREYGLQEAVTVERHRGLARMVKIAPDAIAPGKPSAPLTLGAETLVFVESGPSKVPTIFEAGDLVDNDMVIDLGIQPVELIRPKFDEGRIVYSEGLELVCTPF